MAVEVRRSLMTPLMLCQAVWHPVGISNCYRVPCSVDCISSLQLPTTLTLGGDRAISGRRNGELVLRMKARLVRSVANGRFTRLNADRSGSGIGCRILGWAHDKGERMRDWDNWIAGRSHLASKLKSADPHSPEAYFLKLHATTEAFFRRMLLVGLRLNLVSFDEARDWLHHNDCTPNKVDFPKQFDSLYGPDFSFDMLLDGCPNGQTLWELWQNFAKQVRNHLAHGIRGYGSDWLECGVRINQYLLIELDGAMSKHLGGSIAGNLTGLRPRLPKGRKGVNIPALFGLKKGRQPRPPVSLVDAQNRLIAANLWTPM